MAKKSTKKQEEFLEDEDYSSEDMITYKPNKNDKDELEVDEQAYKMLEHVELEWPSLTIDSLGSKVVVATTPINSSYKPEIISIEVQDSNFENIDYQNLFISEPANKVRVYNGFIFALSDAYLSRYSSKDTSKLQVEGKYSFGLCVTANYVIVGTLNGFVEIYDHALVQKYKFKAGNSSIECVGFENGIVYTGFTDHTVRMFTVTGELKDTLKYNNDINCLDIKNNILIFGDDEGKVHKYDVATKDEVVYDWHQTPISFVRWRDNEIFASGSDEQVCIWDITLQEEKKEESEEKKDDKEHNSQDVVDDEESQRNQKEDDFPVNLLFVHQGQTNYKECCFIENKVITTSEEGLCIFEPVSFFTS